MKQSIEQKIKKLEQEFPGVKIIYNKSSKTSTINEEVFVIGWKKKI